MAPRFLPSVTWWTTVPTAKMRKSEGDPARGSCMPTDTGRGALLQGQSGQKQITKQADRSQGPRCHPSREKAEEGRGCRCSQTEKPPSRTRQGGEGGAGWGLGPSQQSCSFLLILITGGLKISIHTAGPLRSDDSFSNRKIANASKTFKESYQIIMHAKTPKMLTSSNQIFSLAHNV